MAQARAFDRVYARHLKQMSEDPMEMALNSLYTLASAYMKMKH